MPSDPRIRASDADRDRVAALLREHHAAGRLDAGEYDERADSALAARTIGELDELLADLPAIDLYRLPAAGLRRPSPRRGSGPVLAAMPGGNAAVRPGGFRPAWAAAWVTWPAVSLIVLGIYAAGGFGANHWFLGVIALWTAMLAHRSRTRS